MINVNNLCPICEEGNLVEKVDQELVTYKSVSENIPLYFSECSICEMEQGDAIQTRNNKREMLEFRRKIDGLLSGEEIREFRNHCGITQSDFAKIFGGGPVAFSKYENADVSQSSPMDKLIRACRKFPIVFEWLAKKSDVEYRRSKFLGVVSTPLESRNYFSPAIIENNYSIEAKQHALPDCANGNENPEQALQAA